MNLILDTIYRTLKVIYVFAIAASVLVAGFIAWQAKPHTEKISESLYCIVPTSGKSVEKMIRPYILQGEAQELCGLFGYTLDRIKPNYGIVGSWKQAGKIMGWGLFGIYVLSEAIRRIFRYIFFKENPFYMPL